MKSVLFTDAFNRWFNDFQKQIETLRDDTIADEAQKSQTKIWDVCGVLYSSLSQAAKATGIHATTIHKHSKDTGVFNYEKYVEGCMKRKKDWIEL